LDFDQSEASRQLRVFGLFVVSDSASIRVFLQDRLQ
jgi:hypothetical protein